jgi:hypothetical protein
MYGISRQHNLAHLIPVDSSGTRTLNRLKRFFDPQCTLQRNDFEKSQSKTTKYYK